MPAYAYYIQAPPAFEVASVKRGALLKGDSYTINLGKVLNGTVTLSNTTLGDCIRFAYGLSSDQLISGPDWIKSNEFRFDIVAKASPDTSYDQAMLMLQSLLAERFQLAVHREMRELAHYELALGKNGPKLHESKVMPENFDGSIHTASIFSNHLSMPMLSVYLSRLMRATVVDRTGLRSVFEINLTWAPEDDLENPARPSIFTAVQEQLGLKLESKKGPVEVLVIDHAEKVPVEN